MIFLRGKKSDQVVPALLKSHPKWGSRDRNFVAENTYEMVRNRRLIVHCLNGSSDLRRMVGAWLILKGRDDGSDYFEGLNREEITERGKVTLPAIRFSVPDDLNDFMLSELGPERWYTELEAMSRPADVFLRTNLRHLSREQLQEALAARGIETGVVDNMPAALKVLKKANLIATEEFRNGAFEIQDGGSQLIGTFLRPEPGACVVDACAGAGGKTLHIADLMQNKGQILAMDVAADKLKELERRAQRNKVSIVTTGLPEPATLEAYRGKADFLLLDVPCSGTGVLKRNPDAKERLTVNFIREIQDVQQSILDKYSTLVKPGGKMVYATCSLLPTENSRQVEAFLGRNGQFKCLDEQQIWPSETGFDGFYMALLEKAKS